MSDRPAGPDSTIRRAAALLAAREISATELLDAHLERIEELDGERSFDGSPQTINAWVRVYEERARADAARADERLSADAVRRDGPAPALCGIPIGLKDLYAAAGHPRTASCRVVDDRPTEDAAAWARLSAEGMVLLGHLHTHECAAGGSTDQTGNPWDLSRTAGGSSGGSGAALAAGMVMAATGTDTAGSLRIPSALCGTSAIKPTRGAVPLDGIFPLSISLDHAGPMARTVEDCRPLLAAMMGRAAPVAPATAAGPRPLEGLRLLASPRVALVPLAPDVGALYEETLRTCERLGAEVVHHGDPAGLDLDLGTTFLDVLSADMLAFHHRYDARRAGYRQSNRDLLEYAEERALPADEYAAAQLHRLALADGWTAFLRAERIDAIVEPTVPLVAPVRGTGYDRFFTDDAIAYIALTHYWDWTGFPAIALPAGLGPATGLPVGVSLVGVAGDEWRLLDHGEALQRELGLPVAPMARV